MKKCVPYFALLLFTLFIAILFKRHSEILNYDSIYVLSKDSKENQKEVKRDSSIIAKDKTIAKKEMAFAKHGMK
ncbi:hypothetical protein LCGC14_0924810 [marine sediment metagenome]|uniref:Uncharacterized protein n=2 Tax=root TaxID=1 RepID=A0A831QML4_9FLAO|nr:hypothetical protein [Pricia antarctica]